MLVLVSEIQECSMTYRQSEMYNCAKYLKTYHYSLFHPGLHLVYHLKSNRQSEMYNCAKYLKTYHYSLFHPGLHQVYHLKIPSG